MKFQSDGFVLSLFVSSVEGGKLYSTRSLVHSPESNATPLTQPVGSEVGTRKYYNFNMDCAALGKLRK